MCCRFYGWVVWECVSYNIEARWRYASLNMRQNGNHMCLLVHCAAHLLDAASLVFIVCNRCFDAIRISNWSCCSIQCAQRWPTNTISLIYCNGIKLCDCTSLWMVVYFLVTTNCTIFITPSVLITIKCSFFYLFFFENLFQFFWIHW